MGLAGLAGLAGAIMRHATTATRRALYALFTLMVLGAAGPGARQGPAEGSAEGTSHEGAGEQGAAGLAEGTIATGSREEVYVYSSLERHTEDGPEPRYVTVSVCYVRVFMRLFLEGFMRASGAAAASRRVNPTLFAK